MGISQSQNELLGTASDITIILLILLSSYLAEGIGMRKTIILGLLLTGIGGIIPVFTATFQAVLISQTMLGAGLGVHNPLIVTYINSLYFDNTGTALLGVRSLMEALGRTILISFAGILVDINWTASFLVYTIVFPVAPLFALKVPEIRDENSGIPENHVKEKMNPMIFAPVLLATLLAINSIAISVRSASIATEIKEVNFNASNYLVLMPILEILAGFMFGPINKWIRKGTLYLGIIFFIIPNLLIAVSDGNMTFLLTGLFLSNITGSWCFLFIFSSLDKVITKNTINFATSLIFIGCNIGNFIAPIAMQLAQFLTKGTNLTAPSFVLAGIFIAILFAASFVANRKNTRVTRDTSQL